MGLFGGGGGHASAAQDQWLHTLGQLAQQQFRMSKPLLAQQTATGIMGQQAYQSALPGMLQYLTGRMGNAGAQTLSIPGLRAEGQLNAPTASPMDATQDVGQPVGGGGTAHQTAWWQHPWLQYGGVPQFQFPATSGAFSADPERAAIERARIDTGRAQAQSQQSLEMNLAQRLGGTGASGSLLAGASAELAGHQTEANIAARQAILSQEQQDQQNRFAQLANMLAGGLQGLSGQQGMSQAGQSMMGLAEGYGQMAQQQAAQQNQWMKLLGGLGGGLAGLFTGGLGGGATQPYPWGTGY